MNHISDVESLTSVRCLAKKRAIPDVIILRIQRPEFHTLNPEPDFIPDWWIDHVLI